MVTQGAKPCVIGYRVHAAYSALRTRFHAILRESEYPLTPEQWILLSCLMDSGDMRHSEIAQATKRDQTTVTRVVDGVERMGFARRARDPDDRRALRVEITDAGKRAFEATLPLARDFDEALLALFTAEERTLFLGFLDRVTEYARRVP